MGCYYLITGSDPRWQMEPPTYPQHDKQRLEDLVPRLLSIFAARHSTRDDIRAPLWRRGRLRDRRMSRLRNSGGHRQSCWGRERTRPVSTFQYLTAVLQMSIPPARGLG